VTGAGLSEVVDRDAGLIRASGHLTSLGADLLRGTADGLRGSGHVRVVLDLRGVRAADAGGLDILREMRQEFAADGGELVVRA
jgi:anti-anti-sigma regulatory factor